MPYYEVETPKSSILKLTNHMLSDSKKMSIPEFVADLKEQYRDLIDYNNAFPFDIQLYVESLKTLQELQEENIAKKKEGIETTTEEEQDLRQATRSVNKQSSNLISVLMSSDYLGLEAQEKIAKHYGLKGNRLIYSDKEGSKAAEANKLIQLYKAILTHPDSMSTIYRPIDYEFLKTITQKIVVDKAQDEDASLYHVDPYTDVDLLYDFRNGGAGVGQEANSMVDLGRMGELSISEVFGFKNIDVNDENVVKLDPEKSLNLSDKDMNDLMAFLNLDEYSAERIKSELTNVDVMASMVSILNGFVDIAKDPFITQGNWLTSTTNLGNTLLRMGMHPARVIAFMAQPAVRASAGVHLRPNKQVNTSRYINLMIIQEAMRSNKNLTSEEIKKYDEVIKLFTLDAYAIQASPESLHIIDKNLSILNGVLGTNMEVQEFKDLFNPLFGLFDNLESEDQKAYILLKEIPEEYGNLSEVVIEAMNSEIPTDENGEPMFSRTSYISHMADNYLKDGTDYIVEDDIDELNRIIKRIPKTLTVNNKDFKEGFLTFIAANNLIDKSYAPVVEHLLNNSGDFKLNTSASRAAKKVLEENEKLTKEINHVVEMINDMSSEEGATFNFAMDSDLKSWLSNTKSANMDLVFQASVSSMVALTRTITSQIKLNTELSRIDTDGVNKSISTMVAYENKKEMLESQEDSDAAYTLKGFNNKYVNTPMGVKYDNLKKFFRQAIQNTNLFFDLKPAHIEVANKISLLLSNKKIVSTELHDLIRDDIYSAMMTKFFNVSEDKTRYLLQDFPDVFVAFKEARGGEFRILGDLYARKLNKAGAASTLITKSNSEKSNIQEDAMITSWESMLEHPDPAVREFANDLIEYSFVTSGFKFNSKQFYSLIPPSYFIGRDINTFVKNFDISRDVPDFIHRFLRMNAVSNKKLIKEMAIAPGGDLKFETRGGLKLYFGNKEVTKSVTQEYYKYRGGVYKVVLVRGNEIGYQKLPSLGYKIDNTTVPFYGDVRSRETLLDKNYDEEDIDGMRSGTLELFGGDVEKLFRNTIPAKAQPTAYYSQNFRDFSGDVIASEKPNATKTKTNLIGKEVMYGAMPTIVLSIDYGVNGVVDFSLMRRDGVIINISRESIKDLNDYPLTDSPRVEIYKDKNFGRIFEHYGNVYDTYGNKIESLARIPKGATKVNVDSEITSGSTITELFSKKGPKSLTTNIKELIASRKEELLSKGMTQYEYNQLLWNDSLDGLTAEEIEAYLDKC